MTAFHPLRQQVTACLSIVLILVTTPELFSQSPGGVSASLDLWLKANAGAYVTTPPTLAIDGQTVQQWNTQTGSNNFTQATSGNAPIFHTNRINGYPTLEFTGDTFISAGSNVGIASNGSFNMFLVFKQSAYTLGAPTDGSGSFIVDRVTEPNNLMSLKMVTLNRYNYQKRSDSGGNLGGPVSATAAPIGTFTVLDYYRVFNTEFGIYLDGRKDATDNTGVGDAISGTRVQLGRHSVSANQGMKGEMGEVILYATQLTVADRQKVDSYLALKYGITLDPTSMQDYYNSANAKVFPSLTTGTFQPYRWDVAGIIKDDGSLLTQSTSRSQNTNYVVTVSSPNDMTNGEALVWGSNNGSLTTGDVSDIGFGIQRRLARVWKVSETGEVGTVTISFDLSAVPGSKVEADLRLLIDRNNNGFADNDITPIAGTLTGGNLITFTGVNFTSGDAFTIGTTNKSTTPLPVELVSFDAQYTPPVVTLNWKTATEFNNSHFIVQRSLDGKDFFSLGKVDGHGSSSQPYRYSFEDEMPIEGRTYYRLAQFDYDGNVEYSKVATVYVQPSSMVLSVFPNPVSTGSVTISHKSREIRVVSIGLLDVQGHVLDQKKVSYDQGSNTINYALPVSIKQGTYILRIFTDAASESHRLVVLPE